jgi:hypothetical protein
MAQEAARPLVQGVEAQEVVLEQRARREDDAAEQGGVHHALASLLGAQGVHPEIEEHEEDELLGALVRGDGIRGEGGRKQGPHGEGQDRRVEGQVLEPGPALDDTDQVDGHGQGQRDLRGEDRDEAGGRDGGGEAELQPLQAGAGASAHAASLRRWPPRAA